MNDRTRKHTGSSGRSERGTDGPIPDYLIAELSGSYVVCYVVGFKGLEAARPLHPARLYGAAMYGTTLATAPAIPPNYRRCCELPDDGLDSGKHSDSPETVRSSPFHGGGEGDGDVRPPPSLASHLHATSMCLNDPFAV